MNPAATISARKLLEIDLYLAESKRERGDYEAESYYLNLAWASLEALRKQDELAKEG